jgi:hypothetical protein
MANPYVSATTNWGAVFGVGGAGDIGVTREAAEDYRSLINSPEYRLKREWIWSRPMDNRFRDRMRRRADHRRKIIRRRLRTLFWLVVGPPVVVTVFCGLWRLAIAMVVT